MILIANITFSGFGNIDLNTGYLNIKFKIKVKASLEYMS